MHTKAVFAILTIIFSSFLRAETSPDCPHATFSAIKPLADNNKQFKQLKSVASIIHEKYRLNNFSVKILDQLDDCWKKFKTIQDNEAFNQIDIHFEASQESLLVTTPQKNYRVQNSDTNTVLKKLRKIFNTIKRNTKNKNLYDALWHVTNESILSTTENRFNHYIYADDLAKEKLDTEGRSFAVGFTPRFQKDKIYVDTIVDDTFKTAGITKDSIVVKITSPDINIDKQTDWWKQDVPFTYEITLEDTAKPKLFTSVPMVRKSVFATHYKDLLYIQIFYFNKRTNIELTRIFRKLDQSVSGIIIDLRYNGGGIVSPQVIDYFLKPSQSVLRYRRVGEPMQTLDASVAYVPQPLVIIQNNKSASMSELLSATLQYHKRATVIGQPSYGKAVGQIAHNIHNQGLLYLVETEYFYPDGRTNWSDGGVIPNFTIENSNTIKTQVFDLLSENTVNISELARIDKNLQTAISLLEKDL